MQATTSTLLTKSKLPLYSLLSLELAWRMEIIRIFSKINTREGTEAYVIIHIQVQGDKVITFRENVQESEWLVIYGPKGVMETAFPPEDIDEYLNKRGFIFIGQIKEVLQWT